jgi:hypothetical protein
LNFGNLAISFSENEKKGGKKREKKEEKTL